jgi:hypothetical protein
MSLDLVLIIGIALLTILAGILFLVFVEVLSSLTVKRKKRETLI